MAPTGLMPLGKRSPPSGALNVMKVACGETKGVLLKFRTPSFMPAACNRVNVKSTLTLMNMFRRIFAFIRCLWFVCPFTEVLQEIRRDITRKVWIFLGKTADYVAPDQQQAVLVPWFLLFCFPALLILRLQVWRRRKNIAGESPPPDSD